MENNLVPTQAAREAYLSLNMLPEFDAIDVLAGLWDNTTGVQAFARLEASAFAAGRKAEQDEMEQRFWSIVDPNSVPSDMWNALNLMARAYRQATATAIEERGNGE